MIGIEALIKQNKSFVIYRVPEEEPVLILQSAGPSFSLNELDELDGKRGFVFAPFWISDSSPLMLMQPDVFIKGWKDINSYLSKEECAEDTLSEEDTENCPQADNYDSYSQAFSSFISSLREKRFEKLVLSRTSVQPKNSSFSLEKALFNACERYADAFVYLYHTPQTGTWLGSTPEILLSGKDEQWNTVALAGTLPFHRAVLPNAWSEKNIREQQLVVDYVRNQLTAFGVTPEENGPFTVRAGELAHLKSEFSFALPEKGRLGSLLGLLHPTPAVCGLPKEEAYRFILENEGYNRRYYSGFLGWINPDGKTDLYVNLRCMEIGASCLTLYAGGGLLSHSEMELEWKETEAKLQTMLAIIK